eukprot:TRINITY_DN2956_c0_g1_i1.p1 TRINITY_DN2956_c0_g1~~TRINITY_DN2956_c0_g1_i1.p1  ORF type:complete len:186 (-),score=13.13 TRINITY_DN2956_c0_g1_i1:289-846(-)
MRTATQQDCKPWLPSSEPSPVSMNFLGPSCDTGGIEFWHNPERAGWLEKQGAWLPNWRRRWFVLKDGKLMWFKEDVLTPDSQPRGVIEISQCLAIKGAEDAKPCADKQFAFEISTAGSGSQYFVAPSSREKEDWINCIGQAIVRQSRSALAHEHTDYQGGHAATASRCCFRTSSARSFGNDFHAR